ncbi:RNA polymerase sigma factor [Solirubrobacter sp. CPCC 204708]|uniref:RNA polymerase sigma factor n=1 Tax=Solirubrobacter deserti TaxID=2282478 RepID=A0ABT4RJW9_9ACTN|nr:RNA polymerase sigma factor [Solirubrobacter deserti]MBE2315810.1 RNA polymerase sigma factor [Solirubrobacter deserti]MDA0138854.1 RNA polymerase sigma factor [Solirubrobacter deserti]
MSEDHRHDRKLAARAGAGDEQAFAELVARHQDHLRHYVAQRFRPQLAEDAVQEALLSAHRALVGGTRPADVRAWLTTIAWRRASDLTRRERHAVPLDAAVAGRPGDDPAARVLQAHELGRVVRAMRELPERQRQALKLSVLEGRSAAEIGSVLDVPADVARTIVARSRRSLHHRLAAVDLACDDARVEMEAAAARGVRLSGLVTLHLKSCRPCAKLHSSIRRHRRVAVLLPVGLIIRTAALRDKLRDLIAFNPAWEAQIGAAKMCAAACMTLGAGATASAPVITAALPSLVPTATATPTPTATPPAKREKPRKASKPRKPEPTPTATVVARLTPTGTATPVWTATPSPSAKRKQQPRAEISDLDVHGHGATPGYLYAPIIPKSQRQGSASPTPTPTPSPTVVPQG